MESKTDCSGSATPTNSYIRYGERSAQMHQPYAIILPLYSDRHGKAKLQKMGRVSII